jgi:sugar-specific transcriptional regulator TrmB
MSSRDAVDLLEDVLSLVNFSDYEREAYLAILDHGSITATELATATDIPQPRVYDTLRQLDDRNVIELQESRPMRAIALEPTQAFQPAEQSLTTLLAELQHLYTAPSRSNEAAYLVRSTPAIERRLEETIAAAEFELVLSLTPTLLDRFAEELVSARQEGVTIELIVAPVEAAQDPTDYQYSRLASVARGRKGQRTPVVAIADGDRALFTTPRALEDGDSDRYGIVFNRSELGFLVFGFFETILWSTAETTLYDEDSEPTFPREYASLRRCLRDLERADSPVVVAVEGRDVSSDEPRSIEGTVLETELSADRSIATMTVETDTGDSVTVGGRAATFEDVEAHRIRVSTPAADESA